MGKLYDRGKIAFLLVGCVLAGAVGVLVMLGALELYKDLAFLHVARKVSEEQQRIQAVQQQAAPRSVPPVAAPATPAEPSK